MKLGEIINRENAKKIIDIIFAILSVGGIAYYLILGTAEESVNNIIYIPLFFLYYHLYQKMIPNKRRIVFSSMLSVVTSIILIVGAQLEKTSDMYWTVVTGIKVFLLMFALVPIYSKAIEWTEKITERKNCKELNIKRHYFFVVYGILFFFGLLGFLALFPGEYGYDAGYQIMQVQFDDVTITTHFSVLYSFILYGFVKLGDIIFNSYNIGFAIYSFFQMCVLTFVATKICVFTYKLTKRKILLVLTVLFFAIFPLHIIMMLSAAQDTLFCGILALLLMEAYNIAYSSEEFWGKYRNPIKYIVLSILLCMFRNNGMYILLFTGVTTILFVKKYKIRTLVMYVVAISIFFIYKGPIFKAMNVVEVDTIKEMSSIPCQQLARVYTYNRNAYTDSDIDLLNKIFSDTQDELFEFYEIRSSISDSIKATIDTNFVESNGNNIIDLYIRTLIKDPQNYTEGFLLNSIGFWYPNKNYPDSRIYHPFIELEMMDAKKWNERYLDIERHSLFPFYYELLECIVIKNGCNRLPVISSLFTCGTYFLLFVFTIFLCLYKRKYTLLYPLGMIFGYYVTILLSPVCIFRYCYALVLSAPILLAFCVERSNKDICTNMSEK